MIRNSNKNTNTSNNNVLEVKSKYDAEFRRFGLNKQEITKFDDFYSFLERLHGLFEIQFIIYYTDRDGDLLPINNDCNYNYVLNSTVGILRLIIQRKGECYDINMNTTNSNNKYIKQSANLIKNLTNPHTHAVNKPLISYPEDFRPVSAIIDVDIVPETYRRVRLHKHKSSKPLGFYIRDGRSFRVTPNGVEQVPSIFISRLMPGGLAESTGLLSVNDEVIEVNGIEVAGKTLDQVTDMMVANSSNLIITVKPANQRFNLNRSHQSANNTIVSNRSNQNYTSKNKIPSLTSSLSSNSNTTNDQSSTTNQKISSGKNETTINSNNESINNNSNHNQAGINTQNTLLTRTSDEDDDDEEIHDSNTNDDKVLTL